MSRVIYKYYADWCHACKDFQTTSWLAFAVHPDISYREIDIDQHPDQAYAHEVKVLPTIIFLDNDRVVGKVEGSASYDTLMETMSMAFAGGAR